LATFVFADWTASRSEQSASASISSLVISTVI
jgi:hypothetical protein